MISDTTAMPISAGYRYHVCGLIVATDAAGERHPVTVWAGPTTKVFGKRKLGLRYTLADGSRLRRRVGGWLVRTATGERYAIERE